MLLDDIMHIIDMYKLHAPVAHITNFSEGYNIFNKILEITKHLAWTNIKNHNMIELTNGIDCIKLELNNNTLSNSDGELTATKYIYWLLTCSNGFFTDNLDEVYETKKINNIIYYLLDRELSEFVATYEIKRIISKHNSNIVHINKRNINKQIIYNIKIHIMDSKYELVDTLFDIIDFIKNKSGIIELSYYPKTEEIIMYKYKNINDVMMICIPDVKYVKENNDSVGVIIHQMTDLTLLGINKYTGNSNYLILEIKDDVLENQMLDTISMLINSINENKQTIIFINYNEYEENTFNARIFDSVTNTENYNNIETYSTIFEYYLYNFVKSYDENTELIIKLPNSSINLIYYKDESYIYRKS
jgi:hypothetical protein